MNLAQITITSNSDWCRLTIDAADPAVWSIALGLDTGVLSSFDTHLFISQDNKQIALTQRTLMTNNLKCVFAVSTPNNSFAFLCEKGGLGQVTIASPVDNRVNNNGMNDPPQVHFDLFVV